MVVVVGGGETPRTPCGDTKRLYHVCLLTGSVPRRRTSRVPVVTSPPRTRSKSGASGGASASATRANPYLSDDSSESESPEQSDDRGVQTTLANRRCRHVRTGLGDIGSAFVCDSTKCLECGKGVTPCVRCLCYITTNNIKRHRLNCRGSRFELQLSGPMGSRQRVGGKFSKTTKRQKRMPGRSSARELFDNDKFMLVNNVIGRVR